MILCEISVSKIPFSTLSGFVETSPAIAGRTEKEKIRMEIDDKKTLLTGSWRCLAWFINSNPVENFEVLSATVDGTWAVGDCSICRLFAQRMKIQSTDDSCFNSTIANDVNEIGNYNFIKMPGQNKPSVL